MEKEIRLERKMGMKEATTVTIGTVVGVGIFTIGAQCTGILTGGSILLANLLALITCIFPALMYAEMGAMLPYAGGTYNFAKRAINKPVASIAAWHYIIAIVATTAGESLAFANYFSWIFKGMGINLNIDVRILAGILILFFICINYRGIEISSKLQNFFVFFFWIVSAIWMLYMIKNTSFANFIPSSLTSLPGFKDFIGIVTWVWWCYAGFETSIGMGGEIKYPQINIPRSMFIAPFLIFGINGLFQWFLTALIPYEKQTLLATATTPFADGLEMVGYTGLPIVLLCVAIAFGGDLSTMNPGVAAPSRYIYQMGNDGVLPRIFGKLHEKYKTPYLAVIITGLIAFLLILSNSVVLIATISMCSLFWVYIIGFVCFYLLRKKEPEKKRPYRMPFALFGMITSILMYLLMLWSCGWSSILMSFIISLASLCYYFIWARKHSDSDEKLLEQMENNLNLIENEIPSEEESIKMKKEYKTWVTGTVLVTLLVVILYVISFIID